jgi:ribosome-associated protein
MQEVVIRDEYIKLGQALKLAGLVESGVDAKIAVQEGNVLVNGTVCTMRGKKLVDGDSVSYDGESFVIKSEIKK